MKAFFLFQIISVVLTGLLAGLFYGYACSVTKGLGHLPDKEYLGAFQSINAAIQNPSFFLSFMGSLILLGTCTLWSYRLGYTQSFYFLLSALAVYAVGVFGITLFGNVPLNEQLSRFSPGTAPDEELALMRQSFENSWNNLHSIRTLAAIASFVLALFSVLNSKT